MSELRLSRPGVAAAARTGTYGPRAALGLDATAQLTRRARLLIERHSHGARQARLRALAAEFGVDLRTVYRYLREAPAVRVRVGAWSAWFRPQPDGPPRQVTSWEGPR